MIRDDTCNKRLRDRSRIAKHIKAGHRVVKQTRKQPAEVLTDANVD